MRFRNQKEQELGVRDRHEIENEIIFWALSEIKERLDGIEERMSNLEANFLEQSEHLKAMRKSPAPKVLRVAEAAKVLRVSSRKLYYLLDKGVFKRYKLPHTRTTFIKLKEVEKALGAEDISELLT